MTPPTFPANSNKPETKPGWGVNACPSFNRRPRHQIDLVHVNPEDKAGQRQIPWGNINISPGTKLTRKDDLVVQSRTVPLPSRVGRSALPQPAVALSFPTSALLSFPLPSPPHTSSASGPPIKATKGLRVKAHCCPRGCSCPTGPFLACPKRGCAPKGSSLLQRERVPVPKASQLSTSSNLRLIPLIWLSTVIRNRMSENGRQLM